MFTFATLSAAIARRGTRSLSPFSSRELSLLLGLVVDQVGGPSTPAMPTARLFTRHPHERYYSARGAAPIKQLTAPVLIFKVTLRRRQLHVKVAMIGQRGVPATIGGIEHHVEELGERLVSRGHDVTVFCRTNYVSDRPANHRGMTLAYLPTVGTKHGDAISHSALSTARAISQGCDVLHYHALGPGLFTPIARASRRSAVVHTVHGRDDQRAKWGLGATSVLKVASWVSATFPHVTISVSKDLAVFYKERYGRAVDYIPNGAKPAVMCHPSELLVDLDLTPGRYLLFVGRLVPEKTPDLLIRAFSRVDDPNLRLAIVGGSSFTDDYVEQLRALAARDQRVCLTGPLCGPQLAELYSNAGLFVLPSNLEGLPLTLLEAASYGLPIVASDIPPNLEVLESDGPGRRIFRAGNEDGLVHAIERALNDLVLERKGATLTQEHVLSTYQWDAIAEQTEAVYERALARVRRRRARVSIGVQ